MYICLCKGLTESDVQRACESGIESGDCLIKQMGWDDEDCCGRCANKVEDLISIGSVASSLT
jgi:bacterioferritin-associated ferredoxin